MSYVATLEPLFHRLLTVDDLFTRKEAANMVLAKMPDDEKKWPAQIHSELLRALPFIAQYDPEIVLDRVEGEAGTALGYAQVRNRTAARPQDDASKVGNVIRIPIIVQDRRLQPFLVFEAGGETYPLTEDRVEQAMLNPNLFDTDARRVPATPSLVDAMYPPYQQRQGFGRVVEPGAAGLSKISSSPEGELMQKWAKSRVEAGLTDDEKDHDFHLAMMHAPGGGSRYEMEQAIRDGLKHMERPEARSAASRAGGQGGFGAAAGGALGGAIGSFRGQARKGALIGGVAGGLFGAGEALRPMGKARHATHLAGQQAAWDRSRSHRHRARTAAEVAGVLHKYAEVPGSWDMINPALRKAAMVSLNFQKGQGLPGPQIFQKTEGMPRFKIGVLPQNYWFYPLQGTPFLMGVPRKSQKVLEGAKNQAKKLFLLRRLAMTEVKAGMQGLPSPGALILVTREGKGYKYQSPMMHAGGKALQKAASLGKEARIFGALRPARDYLSSAAISEKARHATLRDYWGKKSKEDPTRRSTAMLTGAAVGGLSGGMISLSSPLHPAVAALAGAGVGAIVGGAMQIGDESEIKRVSSLIRATPKAQRGALEDALHQAVVGKAQEERARHQQHMRLLAQNQRPRHTTVIMRGQSGRKSSVSPAKASKYARTYCGSHSPSSMGNCANCGAPMSEADKIASLREWLQRNQGG